MSYTWKNSVMYVLVIQAIRDAVKERYSLLIISY